MLSSTLCLSLLLYCMRCGRLSCFAPAGITDIAVMRLTLAGRLSCTSCYCIVIVVSESKHGQTLTHACYHEGQDITPDLCLFSFVVHIAGFAGGTGQLCMAAGGSRLDRTLCPRHSATLLCAPSHRPQAVATPCSCRSSASIPFQKPPAGILCHAGISVSDSTAGSATILCLRAV